ncbi:MAG: ribonuclease E/G, partial [Pseudomonadota bacterium]
EAADEVARQLRLRDLAGLIVIDFIDMDERKNNAAVEKRMKDRLKTDRARIQVGRISGFGLMEMSRQRLRPGMLEATTQSCPSCHGTGLIRSDDNLALSVLRQIEEEGVRRRSREVLLRCPVGIANFLINHKREHVAQIESRYGLSVRIEGDPTLISPDFSIEKFKTATRIVPQGTEAVVSVDSSLMDEIDAEDEERSEAPAVSEDDDKPKKKRRRRRRRRSRGGAGADGGEGGEDATTPEAADEGPSDADDAAVTETAEGETPEEVADAPKKRSRSRSRRKPRETEESAAAESPEADAPQSAETAQDAGETAPPAKPKRSRSRKKAAPDAGSDNAGSDDAGSEQGSAPGPDAEASAGTAEVAEAAEAADPKPKPRARSRKKAAKPKADAAAGTQQDDAPAAAADPASEVTTAAAPDAAPDPAPAATSDPVAATVSATVSDAEAASDKPKRRGWWSFGK